MADIVKLTSASEIKDYFINTIAPKYFDFEVTNNYNVGIFGMINEIMSNITEDSFNAINIIRREFYPNTAEYMDSLYTMAALQGIKLPLVSPGIVNAILTIPQQDIINNSKYENGIYTFTISDSVQYMADDIEFHTDYPIVIISKKISNNPANWSHTTHYNVDKFNSLSTNYNKYITNNLTYDNNGNPMLMLFVTLRQVSINEINSLITQDTILQQFTTDVHFEGDLCNFEVFYHEEGKPDIQLTKVLENQLPSSDYYCMYNMVDDNTIRITLPSGSALTPAYNSELLVDIYTSLGEDGNFPNYDGELACNIDMSDGSFASRPNIIGYINGSCSGGRNKMTKEEFRQMIIRAYITNHTITTSTDLQAYFESILAAENSTNKMIVKKRRDDAYVRLYSINGLLKDKDGNVVPANTINILAADTDFDYYDENTKVGYIQPGKIIPYNNHSSQSSDWDYYLTRIGFSGAQYISENLTYWDRYDYESGIEFLYTIPFLTRVDIDSQMVSYFLTSMNSSKSLYSKYSNDESIIQFVARSFVVSRDSLHGEPYYKFSFKFMSSSNLDPSIIIDHSSTPNNYTALHAGHISNIYWNAEYNHFAADILYADSSTATIFLNTSIRLPEPSRYIDFSDQTYEELLEYTYQQILYYNSNGVTGYVYNTDAEDNVYDTYTLTVKLGEPFIAGQVIAKKHVVDLGKIRIFATIPNVTLITEYIPFFIEDYDEDNDIYTATAYISTTDIISTNSTIELDKGIIQIAGAMADSHLVPIENISMDIHMFYKYDEVDGNMSHPYEYNEFVNGYTYTNQYSLKSTYSLEDNLIDFANPITFTNSNMILEEVDPVMFPRATYQFRIKEVTGIKASWINNIDLFKYFIEKFKENYEIVSSAIDLLEGGFNLDYKLFNTYGRSKMFKIGYGNIDSENMVLLNSVSCGLRFGIKIKSSTNTNSFLTTLKQYIKEYIESLNDVNANGQFIYIMNLISDMKNTYSDIEYIEYYGINNYGPSDQKIESISVDSLTRNELRTYIPEFININNKWDGTQYIPDIEFVMLE